MPQIHLRAEPGDYAPLVLLPGDPNRATAIASRFDGGLAAARLVNEHRHLFGYSGTFGGVPVSVQTTGIGAPAAAIVVEELLRLGARRLIRVGTCGGIGRGIRTGDLVNAGATWVDEPAFRDANLVWGRVVEDIPAFCRELVAALADHRATK